MSRSSRCSIFLLRKEMSCSEIGKRVFLPEDQFVGGLLQHFALLSFQGSYMGKCGDEWCQQGQPVLGSFLPFDVKRGNEGFPQVLRHWASELIRLRGDWGRAISGDSLAPAALNRQKVQKWREIGEIAKTTNSPSVSARGWNRQWAIKVLWNMPHVWFKIQWSVLASV